MSKDIRAKLSEILELVKMCPDNLHEKCFELLFRHYFSSGASTATLPAQQALDSAVPAEPSSPFKSDEIVLNDIHTKTKALLKGGELTLEDINNLFYKEGNEFKALFDDLGTTKMAESQVRLALLEALKNAMHTGDFKFEVTRVRELCDTHKCLDAANFAANFKKKQALFVDDYKKDGAMSLSSEGKKELIRVAMEIARK